jgi:hypothetical protein
MTDLQTLPTVTNFALAENIERTTARRELKQARKWPEFREDDASRVISAVRAGIPLVRQYVLAGFPSRREISVWKQVNPDFAAELDAAAADRAEELVEKGLEVVQDVNRDPGCRKVESEYYKWLAGKLDARFAPKGSEGSVVNNTQINVGGDINVSPADAYLNMIGG